MGCISKHFNQMKFNQVKFIVQISLIATAITFVCFGAYRGEVESVFTKAIRLCLECVGIG
ncbi:CD1871A family CXXC motif-containing protein [Filifactor alocis]|uniref:CD1871A family CXXC motif-containing protein n=1 Tax=Filifactor alocis TaxID=143361 RepID=UPI003FA13CC9